MEANTNITDDISTEQSNINSVNNDNITPQNDQTTNKSIDDLVDYIPEKEEDGRYHANPPSAMSEEEIKKMKEDQAGAKGAKIAAKAAGEYFAPGVGGKVVDAISNTEEGQQILNTAGRILNQNPLVKRALTKADEDGTLDMADKAVDMVGGSAGGAPGGAPDAAGNIGGNASPGETSNATGMPGNTPNSPKDGQEAASGDNNDDNASGDSGSETGSSDGKSLEEKTGIGSFFRKGNNKNKLMQFIISNPWIIPAVALVLLFLMILLGDDANGVGSGGGGSLATYTNCEYITIEGEGQIEFETYVAGVVTAESGDSRFPEAMKAQAVAARTYALAQTNNCKNPIKNSEANQVYKNPSEAGIAAAEATKGEIMVNEKGVAISANYASYPSGAPFNWSYGTCDAPKCSDTSCSVTLYKVPSGEKHTFTMDRYYEGKTWNGADLTNQAGHCYGMSQLGARFLDYKGYNYTEILNYFYAFTPNNMDEGDGLIAGSIDGYKIRNTKPTENDIEWTTENLFYNAARTLIGQCTWYAHGRSLEILKNSGLSESDFNTAKNILNKMRGNAGTWYNTNKNLGDNGFAYGSEPRIGSIIVWGGSNADKCKNMSYPTAGHVGIVEDIIYNEDGTVKSLMISDGWKTGSGTSWSTVNFQYAEWSMTKVNNYKDGCRPLYGFVYLLK